MLSYCTLAMIKTIQLPSIRQSSLVVLYRILAHYIIGTNSFILYSLEALQHQLDQWSWSKIYILSGILVYLLKCFLILNAMYRYPLLHCMAAIYNKEYLVCPTWVMFSVFDCGASSTAIAWLYQVCLPCCGRTYSLCPIKY